MQPMMKTLLYKHFIGTLLLSFFLIANIKAQDVIYTVKSTVDNHATPVDSILVENISNGTKILFDNLPDLKKYTINLNQKALWGQTIERPNEQNPGFKVTTNYPGYLCLTYNHDLPTVATISIYNMEGRQVYENKNQVFYQGNFVRIYLGPSRFYAVKIESSFGMQGFKALGAMSNANSSTSVEIVHQERAFNSDVSNPVTIDSNFSYKKGDSIRVSVYKRKYFTFPKALRIMGFDSLDFKFKISHEDSTGISNAYLNLNDSSSSYKIVSYDTLNGNTKITFTGKGPDFHPGEIITINLDTTGYLRKVVSVTNKDSVIYLKTTVAQLEDVFVNQQFNLDSKFISPLTTLKSTSSYKEILKALTDNQGYIHPVKIVYRDSTGRSRVLSVFKDAKLQNSNIPIVGFNQSLSKYLYGKTGDDVHFYFNGGIKLKSDAVFHFHFKNEGDISSESKAKKGKLITFTFYLQSTDTVSAHLELDMSHKFSYKKDKVLATLPVSRAKFITPAGVPVWIKFEPTIHGKFSFSSNASMNASWGFESTQKLMVGGQYDRTTKRLSPISSFTNHNTTFPLSISGELDETARLELYPRVDMKIYDVIGPFVEIVPYISGSYNGKTHNQFYDNRWQNFMAWNSSVNLGLDLGVGLTLDLAHLVKKDFGPLTINCFDKVMWDSPAKLELLSSIPENVNIGDKVPLTYKVSDLSGNPVFSCPVYIEGNGSFDHQLPITNSSGQVYTTWTATSSGNSKITATIYNADKSIIGQVKSDILVNNPPPPKAKFVAYPTYGTPPLQITFVDQSTNNPTSWEWDFGDDSAKSTEKSPTHIYRTRGSYPVKLKVTDAYGRSDSKSINNYITVGNAPVADFKASATSGDVPLTVQFTDQSANSPESRKWDFDDGQTSTEKNPIHTFNVARVYAVTLTVTNKFGTDTHKTLINTVKNATSNNSFTDPRDGQVYNTVTIGNQTWMAQNLNYNTTESWWYNNSASNGEIYGRLYTWDAAQSACPNGWHLPSDEEWKQLELTIGMSSEDLNKLTPKYRGTNEGDKLKSKNGWDYDDINEKSGNGTDSYGFKALPGGLETLPDPFAGLGQTGEWWTSTQNSSTDVYVRFIIYNSSRIYRDISAKVSFNGVHWGYSVRCIKNE